MPGMQLHDQDGQRKHLMPVERVRFFRAVEDGPSEVGTFCGDRVYTDCRITEVLEVGADRVDLRAASVAKRIAQRMWG